jgi:hypothetical protein
MANIDTLMLKQVLAQPHWGRESSLLEIWDRVNEYGRFEIDM